MNPDAATATAHAPLPVHTTAPNAPARLDQDQLDHLVTRLKDPIWRLNNLYKITDKHGAIIPFRPTPPQAAIINAIYRHGQRRHIILKARQMGFSTLIDLMLFDAAYFTENTHAAIVDQTQAAASAKLKTKIRFAWDKLPPELRTEPERSNDSEISWNFGSTIIAGKHVRGTTLNWLHISEWGPIAAEDPTRSEEIKTGALPAAENGIILIETTFKGGKGGHLYELIKSAQETPPDQRTPHDFQFWFFPWYLDAGYTLEADPTAQARIPADVTEYLDQKERELGRTFTAGQRLWYAKKKAQQGIFMHREYPTTPDEAFMAPVEGSIYGDIISRIRAAGQIRDFLPDPAYPTYAIYDIGWNDATSVWLLQIIGRDLYFTHHYRERQLTAAQTLALIQTNGQPIAAHILPHDAANKGPATGLSYAQALTNAGAANIRTLPRTHDKWAGINAARDLLPRSYIHATHCAQGLEALEAYHTRETTTNGAITKEPVHDWSSHDADAFRYAAEALQLGLIQTADARRAIATHIPPHLRLNSPRATSTLGTLTRRPHHRTASHDTPRALSPIR